MSDGFVSASHLRNATAGCSHDSSEETIATSSSACVSKDDNHKVNAASLNTNPKKRKIHLNSQQCMDYLNTEQGAMALTTPFKVKKSSRDASCGLYPREHQTVALKPGSFVSAGDILNPGAAYLKQVESANKSQTKCAKRNRKKMPTQSNSMHNYFEKLNTAVSSNDASKSTEQTTSGDQARDVIKCSSVGSSQQSFVSDIVDTDSNNSTDFVSDHEKLVSNTSSASHPDSIAVNDLYGLLGTEMNDSDFDDINVDYTEDLPLEVLENILCRLPLMDLCLNVNRVCQRWNLVISNEKFIFWKKRYHRLKAGSEEDTVLMTKILLANGMKTIDTYLPGLIRYMKDFKPVTASNMLCCLQNHPRYRWAKDMLLERFPECCVNEEPNAWCVVTSLVVLSEKVHHIQMINWCLLDAESQCTATEVLECLYCIASFLLTFKTLRQNDVWMGMHYRLFYAIYLYENSCVSTCRQLSSVFSGRMGQQCIVKYSISQCSIRLTHEQLTICNHTLQPGELIKIVAFAGTGKTTTLVRYAQLRPDWRFLLVVYNKSVCEYAKTKFPANVTCKTGHSLGFHAVGRRYSAARQLSGNLNISSIVEMLPLRKGLSIFVQAKFVMDTLYKFTSSAEREVTLAHVPESLKDGKDKVTLIGHDMRMLIADDAAMVWRRMQDLKDTKVMMTHDGYLKMYQLQTPQLHGYDVIMIDEAQDLTPAISDIVLSQSCAKIVVGDPHQQIYAFRGAINAIRQLHASHTFYLTQSFRFGPEIAFVAATCLEMLKQEKHKTLVGNSAPGGILGDSVGQVAIISRTNFVLFAEAVKKCCYSSEPIRVAFAGGIDGFGFGMLQDVYNLMLPKSTRGTIHSRFLQKFSNLGELERYATKVYDVELVGKIKIVKTYTNSLPSLLKKIRSKTIHNMETADVVFSTAHKAKGLEFNTVKVTDDFCVSLQQPNGPMLQEDEANLLYVAVTRAKKRLLLTPTLVKILRDAGEKFFYPVHSEQLEKQSVPFRCLFSEEDWKPYAITLTRKTLQVEQDNHRSGVISPKVVSQELYSWRHLLGVKCTDKTAKNSQQHSQRYSMDLYNNVQLPVAEYDGYVMYPF